MIAGELVHRRRYGALHPFFADALEFLANFDPGSPDGRIELDGERLIAVIERYESSPATGRPFEAHRRYIDIQCVLEGRERILHCHLEGLEPLEEYSREADVAFYEDPTATSSILVRPGEFVILFPEDAHKPGCMAGGRDAVRKVVVKVEAQPLDPHG